MSAEAVDTPSATEATEATDAVSRPSRRFVMAASAGLAAAAAAAMVSCGTAGANDGDSLTLGSEDNLAQSTTRVIGPSFVVTDGGVEGSRLRCVGGVTTGVYGVTSESAAGTVSTRAVWGVDETPGGVGVFGQHGTTGEGAGVIGQSFHGHGVGARGTTFDLLLQQSGRMNFVSAGQIAPTTTAPVGTLARSDDGSLWYAKGDSDWVRLAGANERRRSRRPNRHASTTHAHRTHSRALSARAGAGACRCGRDVTSPPARSPKRTSWRPKPLACPTT